MVAKIRKDLLKDGLAVPISIGDKTKYLRGKNGYNYRWISEDDFQICYRGKWWDAYSIDFDF